MKKIFYLFILLFAFGCSDFNKVLKSDDPEYKYEKAKEYYNNCDVYKSLPLLEELIGITRGTTRSEDVYYNYANVHYCLRQYYLANYYYKQFAKTFPTSERCENALFLAAISNYKNSPNYSIDQTETISAINEFQYFLDRYPNTNLKDSTNTMIAELRSKLEVKDFEIAKLYHKTEQFQGAVLALEGFNKEFPGSDFKELSMYLIVDSRFNYAKNSVVGKQRSRYEQCKEDYDNFNTYFPAGEYAKKAKNISERIDKEIENSYYAEAKLAFDNGGYGEAYAKFKHYINKYQAGDSREKAMYYAVKSAFLHAKTLPTEKKKASFEKCIESYINFADSFPNSKWLGKAEKYYLDSKNKIENIS